MKSSFNLHCPKNVRIWSFYGPYFPAFVLSTERYYLSAFILCAGKYGPEKLRIGTLFTFTQCCCEITNMNET